MCPPMGDLARNPGMCPNWELNQQPCRLQAGTQSTEPHQPGQGKNVLKWMCPIICLNLLNQENKQKQPLTVFLLRKSGYFIFTSSLFNLWLRFFTIANIVFCSFVNIDCINPQSDRHHNGTDKNGNQINYSRGKCCLSVLSLTPKLQCDPKTSTIVYCLSFVMLQKAVDYLGRASKAIKKIPYVKLHFPDRTN